MASNVINLRQARKTKTRADNDKAADQNRRLHGLTKAEKHADQRARQDATKHLDGHKRDPEKR